MPEVKKPLLSAYAKIVDLAPMLLAFLILGALLIQTQPNDLKFKYTDREVPGKSGWLFANRPPCEIKSMQAIAAYDKIEEGWVERNGAGDSDDCKLSDVVGKASMTAIAQGAVIDPTSGLTPAMLDRSTQYVVISIIVNDPAGIAKPGATVSLLFIETRDIRTLPASPVVGTSIDGAIVLKVTKSDTEPKLQILFAIPEGEGIAETLARFANQVPAQITSAAA